MSKIGVIGAGSWGSALALSFAAHNEVILYVRNTEQYNHILNFGNNLGYLPEDILLGNNIQVVNDLSNLRNCEILILAMPINSMRSVIIHIKSIYDKLPHIIWVCKGFEHSTQMLPHNIIDEELPGFTNYAALLGPSFANEVARFKPTAICLSGNNGEYLSKLLALISPHRNFRVYLNYDLIGSEVGSAVKNVLAIMVGVSDGLGLGYNARSALITRSLNELSLLVIALGGKKDTIYGLTGIGDLILTCTGDLSRNRKVGLELANGKSLSEITASLGHVAEGVKSCQVIKLLGQKHNLDLPIINGVYDLLYNSINPMEILNSLMDRNFKVEFA